MLLLLLGMSRLVVPATVWRDYADMQYNTVKSILNIRTIMCSCNNSFICCGGPCCGITPKQRLTSKNTRSHYHKTLQHTQGPAGGAVLLVNSHGETQR